MTRLRLDGPVSEMQVAARCAWCQRVLDTTEAGTRARAELVAQMAQALGLSRSRCHELLRRYEGEGVDGLRRRRRRDAH